MEQDIKTILIAEDEDDLREMYTRALSNGGFEVLQAVNGAEALEWLEKKYNEINFILLDIVMPGMDGFEALGKIKKDERFGKIPVLVSTNLDNDEDKQQALELGAKEYFVKSQHTPMELVEKVNSIFAQEARATNRRMV
ncbi:MAG: Two-component hybrid sensor and regulator [Parcubacteria group bacterium GW2011_GWD2_38_11]|nr:MAG: Two-component hybrid sensor and regulator [Parcubacteria group bacterium GW2011_GWD2_38_11]